MYLTVESNCEEHDKEEDCPQLGEGEFGHCLRVHNEGDAWS